MVLLSLSLSMPPRMAWRGLSAPESSRTTQVMLQSASQADGFEKILMIHPFHPIYSLR